MVGRLFCAYVVVKNWGQTIGGTQFAAKIFLHDPLKILLLVLLFKVGEPLNAITILSTYPYFIPLFAFLAGLISWETELFFGLTKQYLSGIATALLSRILYILVNAGVPLLIFFGLGFWEGLESIHFLNMAGQWIAFAFLGAAVGFRFGMHKEKAINNVHYVATWILALGTGLFANNDMFIISSLLPQSVGQGGLQYELYKWVGCCLIACFLFREGVKPRKQAFF